MMATMNSNIQARQVAEQPKRELEIQRHIAARLTAGNVRIQEDLFLTEEDLEADRLRVLAYQLDL